MEKKKEKKGLMCIHMRLSRPTFRQWRWRRRRWQWQRERQRHVFICTTTVFSMQFSAQKNIFITTNICSMQLNTPICGNFVVFFPCLFSFYSASCMLQLVKVVVLTVYACVYVCVVLALFSFSRHTTRTSYICIGTYSFIKIHMLPLMWIRFTCIKSSINCY